MADPTIKRGPSGEIPALGYDPTTKHAMVPLEVVNVVQDATTGQWYGILNVNASFNASSLAVNDANTPANTLLVNSDGSINVNAAAAANQRVNAHSGDFVAGSVVDLATLLTLAGTSGDANTVASLMGRLTKIRDLLNATLTVQGTIIEANSAAILVDLAILAGAISGGKMLTTETSSAGIKSDLDTLVTQTNGVATAANQATGNTSLASIVTNTANIPAKGQATMANSTPVVLASNQSTVPISGTITANAGTNLNTSTLALESGGNLATLAGGITSSKYQSNNAQVAGTTTSVNAGNRDAGTQRFIEAGNGTSTVTQVGSANTDTSLLAANANKKGTLFFNDSTATLYLLYGTGTASTTNYSVQVPPKAYFEDPLHYTGGFHGIWSAANGFVYCTEVS
jgi:hypothetical protein